MEHDGLDIRRFRRWALGNLVNNEIRGTFAEWLVGRALGCIGDSDVRQGWDAYDLQYGRVKVEVKASGRSQSWNLHQPSKPSFDIAPRKWTWRESTDEWIENDPPARSADVYVFCLHKPVPATNRNVRDPTAWEFWVISRQTLDKKLGPQKSVGLGTLDHLTGPTGRVTWPEIKAEVDRCTSGGAG